VVRVMLPPPLQEERRHDIPVVMSVYSGRSFWKLCCNITKFLPGNYRIKPVHFEINHILTKIITAVCLFSCYIFNNVQNY
jgi:hypothetical protein